MSERKRAAASAASQAFRESETLAQGEFISPEHFKTQGAPGRAAGPFGEKIRVANHRIGDLEDFHKGGVPA